MLGCQFGKSAYVSLTSSDTICPLIAETSFDPHLTNQCLCTDLAVCFEQKCPICHQEVAAAQDSNKGEGVKQSAPVLMSKKTATNA